MCTEPFSNDEERNLVETFFQNHHFDNLEVLEEAVRDWQVDFLLLDRGTADTRMLQLSHQGNLLGYLRSNRKPNHRGATPAAMWTFTLLSPGTPMLFWGGREIQNNVIIVSPAGTSFDSISLPGFSIQSASIAPRELERICEGLRMPELPVLLRSKRTVCCDPRQARDAWNKIELLSGLCFYYFREQSDSAIHYALRGEVFEALMFTLAAGKPVADSKRGELLHNVSPGASTSTFAPRPTAACPSRRCATRPRSTSAPCSISSEPPTASRPKPNLKAPGLHRVRKELYRAEPARGTISEIAKRPGFRHMEQFTADHKAHFGDLPSQPPQQP